MAAAHVLHNLQECTDRLARLETQYEQLEATIRQNMDQLSQLRQQLTTVVHDTGSASDVTVPPASRRPIPAGASSLHGTVGDEVTAPPQPPTPSSSTPAPPEDKTGMGDIPPPPPHPATGPADRDPLQPPAASVNEEQYRQREARGQVRTPEEREQDAQDEKKAEEQASAARVKAGDAQDKAEAEKKAADEQAAAHRSPGSSSRGSRSASDKGKG